LRVSWARSCVLETGHKPTHIIFNKNATSKYIATYLFSGNLVYYKLSLSNIRRQEEVVILFILFVTIDKTIPI
ncbi:hypothetical protein, partial [Escherichia coli]|uniref:hypothetical protein n=1 Tax=Escherichia coli TaxID=562 RepID=UPI003F88A616